MFPTFLGAIDQSIFWDEYLEVCGIPWDERARVAYMVHNVEFFTPIKVGAKVRVEQELIDVHDKGNGGQTFLKLDYFDAEEEGIKYASIYTELLNFGYSGFGYKSERKNFRIYMPDRTPDAVVIETIPKNSVAIYRLIGAYNPAYIDPDYSKLHNFGSSKPILGGM